jgi:hypothetical protein
LIFDKLNVIIKITQYKIHSVIMVRLFNHFDNVLLLRVDYSLIEHMWNTVHNGTSNIIMESVINIIAQTMENGE